jgi:hypothetical protein
VVVKIIAGGLDDLRADTQNRRLPWCTNPQMPVLHEEFDPVLLERDGKRSLFAHTLKHLNIIDIQLEAAGGALIRSHTAGHDDAGFLGQPAYPLENLSRHCGLGHDALHRPCAVAEDGEQKLPAFAHVIEPSP